MEKCDLLTLRNGKNLGRWGHRKIVMVKVRAVVVYPYLFGPYKRPCLSRCRSRDRALKKPPSTPLFEKGEGWLEGKARYLYPIILKAFDSD